MAREKTILTVNGMSCSHCVNAVKKAVGSLNGVDNVDVELEGKKATIEYDSSLVSIQQIQETIEDQGYDVTD